MIPELREKVARLHDLLQDPQPGLVTWSESVVSLMKLVRRAINETLGDV